MHRCKKIATVLVVVVLLGLFHGCYSLALYRDTHVVSVPGQDSVVDVEVWRQVGSSLGGNAVVAVLGYPLDVVISTGQAIGTLFHSDFDIRWGPAGALLGIIIPGITLIPGLTVPQHEQHEVSPAEFERLIRAMQGGAGERAAREMLELTGSDIVRIKLLRRCSSREPDPPQAEKHDEQQAHRPNTKLRSARYRMSPSCPKTAPRQSCG